MRWWLSISVTILLIIGGLAITQTLRRAPAPPGTIAQSPSPVPPATSTAPSVAPLLSPKQITIYAELLGSIPLMENATIEKEKLPLEQAARIHLPYWAYVCPRRDLWICHPDAPSITAVKPQVSEAIHLTREQVVFVHWLSHQRVYQPLPVIRDEAGNFHAVGRQAGTVKLQRRDYHWTHAVSLGDRFVVPTDQGISLITAGETITESYRELFDEPGAIPEIELTPQGFLAWVPTSQPQAGTQAAWYSKGAWQVLPDGWSQAFLQLICFEDGSVLQIIPESLGTVRLQVTPLETAPSDAIKIKHLVARLSDESSDVRDAAHAQLVAMGPGAWKLLQELLVNAHGEAQMRLEEITALKTRPALGRFTILQNQLRAIWRLRDGVVFLAEAGVQVPSGGATDEQVTPAWIVVRRGRPIELLPPALARNLAVGAIDLSADANEWLVADAASGAQLFFGQELFPLTKEKDFRYRQLVGIDRQNRVLLAPVDGKPYGSDLLLIDPTVADPTPLLPIWTITVEGGEAGWTNDDWPAVKRKGAYTLKQLGWDATNGELASSPPPATRPATAGTLTQAPGQIQGSTVWLDDVALELHDASGKSIRQARLGDLPPGQLAAAISGQRLYLLHSQSRISRLLVTPGQEHPFALEAVFTEDVPYVAGLQRMWTDPAGRICIATADSRLIVIFPDRNIPPGMMDLIPASELKQAHPK